MGAPLGKLDIAPVTLDPANLPEFALRTTLDDWRSPAAGKTAGEQGIAVRKLDMPFTLRST
jgi:hypothetical protein